MDRLTIYQAFFEQMNEAVEWMLQEENGRVVSAYIDAAASLSTRLLEALPKVNGYHISLTGEQAKKFSDEWRKADVDA